MNPQPGQRNQGQPAQQAAQQPDDWREGNFPSAEPDAIDAFQMGRIRPSKSSNQIDEEGAKYNSKEIPVGFHKLYVEGFFKAPEPVSRSAYVRGQLVNYTAYKLGVRLAMVEDPAAQGLLFLDLPPFAENDGDLGIEAYLNGSKKPDGKNPGVMAGKTLAFLGKLNPEWRVEAGQELPEDALMLGNWKGRQLWGEVKEGDQEIDQQTGQPKIDDKTGLPKVPRNEFKMHGFVSVAEVEGPTAQTRAGQPIPGRAGATQTGAAQATTTQPVQPVQPVQPARPTGPRPAAGAAPSAAQAARQRIAGNI